MKEKLRASEFVVSRNAAAKFLGVSYKTLAQIDLPFFKIGNSYVRYRQKDLDKMEEEGIQNAGAAKVA